MNNKFVNKILNYIFIILIILFFIVMIIHIVEPLKYDMNIKIEGENLDKSPYVYSALDKYIYAIKREKIEDINNTLPFVKRKSDEKYREYSNYINENFKNLNIISIHEIDKSKVLVKYSINNEIVNNVIMKIYEDNDTFKVYYDEKLENI